MLLPMEPSIRYAKTEDGTAIAFWAAGSGFPLVHLPWMPWSNVQLEQQNPELMRWYEELSSLAMLIRYDGRGTGLSDRLDPDLTLEAQVRDIEAVVERLELERLVLMGVYHSGPAALVYAAKHPGQVAGLILWCTFASGEDYYRSPRVQSILKIVDDWELYTETGAHAFVGWESGEAAHQIAAMMRECVSPETARAFFRVMAGIDCRNLLGSIRAPALVLHPLRFPLIDLELSKQLAAGITEASLVTIEGSSLAPTRADLARTTRAIREFLQATVYPETAALPSAPVSTLLPALEPVPRQDGLTSREVEVLQLLAGGQSNREIADTLVLSTRTVERHVLNIYAKINVNNRSQATAYYLSNYR